MREWWSPAEIADARLPDLPATKRRVNDLIDRDGWRGRTGCARRRDGREGGGGWEYHYKLFPSRAQAIVVAALTGAAAAEPAPERRDREDAWRDYDSLPDTTKAKARAKLAAIDAFEALVAGGHTRHSAAAMAARIHGCSARSIWNWLAEIDGVRRDDRLAYLVPRHRLATRKFERAECDPEAWAWFLGHYLRLSRPSLTGSYRDTARVAGREGWAWPCEQTIRRRLEREVDRPTLVRRRGGLEALKQLYPPQRRTKDHLHALEAVKAVPLELFREVVAERIAEHNTRRGRRSAVTGGRSFVEAFEESYASAPIRWATEAQRRMCLMGVVTLTARQPEGRIEFQGNRYWAPFMTGLIGKKVAVRFDPADLKSGVHIEALDGRYLGEAACIEDVGFDDIEGAKEYGRLQRQWVKAEKTATSAIQMAARIELQNALSSSGAPDDAPPAPSKVVRLVRGRGGAAAAAAQAPEIDQDAAMDAYVRGIRLLHAIDD